MPTPPQASAKATRRRINPAVTVELPDLGPVEIVYDNDALERLEEVLDPLLVAYRRARAEEVALVADDDLERLAEAFADARRRAIEAAIEGLDAIDDADTHARVVKILSAAGRPEGFGAAGIPVNVWDAIDDLLHRWPFRVMGPLIRHGLAHAGYTDADLKALPPWIYNDDGLVAAVQLALGRAFGMDEDTLAEIAEDVPPTNRATRREAARNQGSTGRSSSGSGPPPRRQD